MGGLAVSICLESLTLNDMTRSTATPCTEFDYDAGKQFFKKKFVSLNRSSTKEVYTQCVARAHQLQ